MHVNVHFRTSGLQIPTTKKPQTAEPSSEAAVAADRAGSAQAVVAVGWSFWRRRHQVVARACHYRRRRQRENL